MAKQNEVRAAYLFAACCSIPSSLSFTFLLKTDEWNPNPILSATIQGLQVLHFRPWMFGSKIENHHGVLDSFLTMLDPPSWSLATHLELWCTYADKKIRHGWILIWKQNSFGLTVILGALLGRRGSEIKVDWATSEAMLKSYTAHFYPSVCVPHTHKGHKPKWFKGLQWNLQ